MCFRYQDEMQNAWPGPLLQPMIVTQGMPKTCKKSKHSTKKREK